MFQFWEQRGLESSTLNNANITKSKIDTFILNEGNGKQTNK